MARFATLKDNLRESGGGRAVGRRKGSRCLYAGKRRLDHATRAHARVDTGPGDPRGRTARISIMYVAGESASMRANGLVRRHGPAPDATGPNRAAMPTNDELQLWLFAVAQSADRN